MKRLDAREPGPSPVLRVRMPRALLEAIQGAADGDVAAWVRGRLREAVSRQEAAERRRRHRWGSRENTVDPGPADCDTVSGNEGSEDPW